MSVDTVCVSLEEGETVASLNCLSAFMSVDTYFAGWHERRRAGGVSIAFRLLCRLILCGRQRTSQGVLARLNCLSAFMSVDTRYERARERAELL